MLTIHSHIVEKQTYILYLGRPQKSYILGRYDSSFISAILKQYTLVLLLIKSHHMPKKADNNAT